jgi:uncharacterized protein (DUF885 family)
MLPVPRSARAVSSLVLFFLIAMPAHTADSLETRRQQLTKALAEEWEYVLRESPESATAYGDYRYNDKWTDISLAHIEQRRKDAEQFLARFQAIDPTGFPEQEQINRQLMIGRYQDALHDLDLKNYLMPVDQFNGIQIMLPQIAAIVPTATVKQYEDYLARLQKLPQLLDQVTALLKQGEQQHLMPPKFLLEKVVDQCHSIAAAAGKDSAFAQPLAHFPSSISAADKKRLSDAIVAAIDQQVRPAYTKLETFIKDDYAPKGRTEPGLWALPDGLKPKCR